MALLWPFQINPTHGGQMTQIEFSAAGGNSFVHTKII